MNQSPYRMSFTTGGLGHSESLLLVSLYLDLRDWDVVRKQVEQDNSLQVKKASSSKRVARELITRLKALTRPELEFLADASPQDQRYVLWLANCRCYSFIAEFALEVLREHYLSLKATVTLDDFDAFFNKKAEWHEELDRMTLASRKKVRQVLFRILREAQLLSTDQRIIAPRPSPALQQMVFQSFCSEVLEFSGRHLPRRASA